MTKKRIAKVKRKTKETDINVSLNIDGSGKSLIKYPIPFLGHMLTLFSKHGLFDITLSARGDIEVDSHHLIEDTGITLGEAFHKALGNKFKLERYGHSIVPMDEALAEVKAAIDISGRPHLTYKVKFEKEPIYAMSKRNSFRMLLDAEMLREFFQAFVMKAGISMHIDLIRGKNTHHKIEALFKAFAVSLREACKVNPRVKGVPSTKGIL